MKPPPFSYHAPDSRGGVLALLEEHGGDARVLAGGQSLLPLLYQREQAPGHLIDVNRIPDLVAISPDDDGALHIGAMVRQRTLERVEHRAQPWPMLTTAVGLIGHAAIRNRGTIGGSLAHADPGAELPAVAVALDAELLVESNRAARTIAADDFFTGAFSNGLDPEELLVGVRFPGVPDGTGTAFREVTRRSRDFALVAAAALMTLDDAGAIASVALSLAGVDERPVRDRRLEDTLVGQQPTTAVFTEAASTLAGGLTPAADLHGSASYRRHLARVLSTQVLEDAARRAGGSDD